MSIPKLDLPKLNNSNGTSPISKKDKTQDNILNAIAILMKELDENSLNSLKKDIEAKLSSMGIGNKNFN